MLEKNLQVCMPVEELYSVQGAVTEVMNTLENEPDEQIDRDGSLVYI